LVRAILRAVAVNHKIRNSVGPEPDAKNCLKIARHLIEAEQKIAPLLFQGLIGPWEGI